MSWLSVCYAQYTVDFIIYFWSWYLSHLFYSTLYDRWNRSNQQTQQYWCQTSRQEDTLDFSIASSQDEISNFYRREKEKSKKTRYFLILHRASSQDINFYLVNNTWLFPDCFLLCLMIHKRKLGLVTQNDNDDEKLMNHIEFWIKMLFTIPCMTTQKKKIDGHVSLFCFLIITQKNAHLLDLLDGTSFRFDFPLLRT